MGFRGRLAARNDKPSVSCDREGDVSNNWKCDSRYRANCLFILDCWKSLIGAYSFSGFKFAPDFEVALMFRTL